MQASAHLLLDNQFHRAVIGAMNGIVDDYVLDTRHERFGNEKIVDPPADIALPRRAKRVPPRILNPVGIKVTIGVHEAMIEKVLDPGTFLRQESRSSLIGAPVLQVDRHRRGVEVTCNNAVPIAGVNAVT